MSIADFNFNLFLSELYVISNYYDGPTPTPTPTGRPEPTEPTAHFSVEDVYFPN